MSGKTKKLFCFGLGYSATALARRLRAESGWQIAGTVRDETSLSGFTDLGIDAQLFDGLGQGGQLTIQ